MLEEHRFRTLPEVMVALRCLGGRLELVGSDFVPASGLDKQASRLHRSCGMHALDAQDSATMLEEHRFRTLPEVMVALRCLGGRLELVAVALLGMTL